MSNATDQLKRDFCKCVECAARHRRQSEVFADIIAEKRRRADELEASSYRPHQFLRERIAELRQEADRLEAALRRDCASIERIVRDAILGYGEMFRIAPNDESEAELKARAETANAWLERHGFTREEITWTKEED